MELGSPSDGLARARAAYDASCYLDCHRELKALGYFNGNADNPALLLAARTARHLGAQGKWIRWIVAAYRANPRDMEVQLNYGWVLSLTRGPYELFRYLNQCALDLERCPASLCREFSVLRLSMWLDFRDLEQAEKELRELEAAGEQQAEVLVWKARILQRADQFDAALQLALSGLGRFEGNRDFVLVTAQLLCLHRRYQEALACLQTADRLLQASGVAWLAASISLELGRYEEHGVWLQRVEELTPLRDSATESRLAGHWSDHHYMAGRYSQAQTWAERSALPFFQRIADRLRTSVPGQSAQERVELAVPWVAQHHMTCSPATLTMLAGYFGRNVDQVQVADQICYEGTPSRSERRWAQANGWVTREFTLTESAARALLRRGIPVAVVTVESDSAHIQVVNGFDGRRGTLLVRDPSLLFQAEVASAEFFERYRAFGPRALVLCPKEELGRLADIELPETELYDLAFEVADCLDRHQRTQAVAALERLGNSAPEGYLRWTSERLLANYDRDTQRLLDCTRRFLVVYPNDVGARLTVAGCLEELAPSDEVIAYLKGCLETTPREPALVVRLASAWLDDARNHPRAESLLRRTLKEGLRSQALRLLALVCDARGEPKSTLEHWRLAACSEPTQDYCARAYHSTAFSQGKGESALSFLEHRVRNWGPRSAEPWIVLLEAHDRMDRHADAQACLTRSLVARPDDSRLLCWAAEFYARIGEPEVAAEHLARAAQCCSEAELAGTRCRVAELRGEPQEALEAARRLVDIEPKRTEHHQTLCRLLGAIEGPDSVEAYLDALCLDNPDHIGFAVLRVEHLRAIEPERFRAALFALIQKTPRNAWAYRELAYSYLADQKQQPAESACSTADALDPHSPATKLLKAILAKRSGDLNGAQLLLGDAIRLSPDFAPAVSEYLDLNPIRAEQAERLVAIWEAISLGSVHSGAYLNACRTACVVWAEEESLGRLRENTMRRPGVWATWQGLARAYEHFGRFTEGLEVARELTRRFPFVPGSWLTAAELALRVSSDGEMLEFAEQCCHDALRINPTFAPAASGLVDVLRRKAGNAESGPPTADLALATVDRALRSTPSSVELLRLAAELLALSGRHQEALDKLKVALSFDPSDLGTWRQVCTQCDFLGVDSASRGNRALPESWATEFVARRPWQNGVWLALAQVRYHFEQHEAARTALLTYLERVPRNAWALDLLALVHTALRDRDSALRVCEFQVDAIDRPLFATRRAWVLFQFGERTEALQAIQEVAGLHPQYLTAWRRIADWSEELGQLEVSSAAAEKLVTLAPGEATSHGYAAAAILALEDRHHRIEDRTSSRVPEIAQHLRRALELDPSYEYALQQLWRLAKEFRHPGLLLDALPACVAYMSSGRKAYWTLLSALLREDRDAAALAARAACFHSELSSRDVVRGWELWRDYDSLRAGQALEQWVAEQNVRPELCECWVRWFNRTTRKADRRIQAMIESNEKLAAALLVEYFDLLAERGTPRETKRAFKRLNKYAKPHDQAWGKVGFALTTHSLYPLVVQWKNDYERRQPEQWMLYNYAFALISEGYTSSARRVSEAAMRLTPDDTIFRHAAVAGLLAVLDDDLTAAQEATKRQLTSEGSSLDKWCEKMRNHFLELESGWPAEKKAAARGLRRGILDSSVLRAVLAPAGGVLYRRTSLLVWRRFRWYVPAALLGFAPYILLAVSCALLIAIPRTFTASTFVYYGFYVVSWRVRCRNEGRALANV